ncbi:unnamed protein product, partial [Tilletia caries]
MSNTDASYEALAAEVAELRRLLAQRDTSASPATNEPNFKVKVADPPTFDGSSKKDAYTFLAHI